MATTFPLDRQKALLRQELRKKLDCLPAAERARRGEAAVRQLLVHRRYQEARSVFSYVALNFEVETRPFLEESWRKGKKVFVPRIDPGLKRMRMVQIENLESLKPGRYGILEPAPGSGRPGDPGDLDLAVVPGMAFDREGGRLGRGKGYFDRFLQEAGRAYKIGLAFKFQLVEKVPCEAHDVRVDEVLTE